MGVERKLYKLLMGKPEGKKPLERPGRRRGDGIRIDVREIGWGMEWIQFAEDRDLLRAAVNTVMNSIKPSGAISRVR
jgi:hypothetical protein